MYTDNCQCPCCYKTDLVMWCEINNWLALLLCKDCIWLVQYERW